MSLTTKKIIAKEFNGFDVSRYLSEEKRKNLEQNLVNYETEYKSTGDGRLKRNTVASVPEDTEWSIDKFRLKAEQRDYFNRLDDPVRYGFSLGLHEIRGGNKTYTVEIFVVKGFNDNINTGEFDTVTVKFLKV